MTRTHCRSGKHEWIPENLMSNPTSNGKWTCRLCHNERKNRERKKANARFGTCAHCKGEKLHIRTRGLCARCYQHLVTYDREMLFSCYPTRNMKCEDRLEDYEWLVRTEGLNVRQAAERMGIKPISLEQAIARARRKRGEA